MMFILSLRILGFIGFREVKIDNLLMECGKFFKIVYGY